MRTPIGQVRWLRSQIAERFASACLSASCYRLAEDVGFLPVVETELELREVQREILLADVVEPADDAMFEQRPEPFDAVRMNHATYIFARAVADDLMREAEILSALLE